jgi:two-component system, NarL family, nitrate/nitrite response regulator NarL
VIRVLIADNHPIVLSGLTTVLEREDEIEVIEKTSRSENVLQLTREHQPDVLILDINMEGLEYLPFFNQIHDDRIPTRSLILTENQEHEAVVKSIRAGIHGYLLKSDSETMIVSALKAVANGRVWFSPSTRSVVLGWVRELVGQEPENK